MRALEQVQRLAPAALCSDLCESGTAAQGGGEADALLSAWLHRRSVPVLV